MNTTFEDTAPANFGGQTTLKIRRDFGQLQILIDNISGTDNAIDKMKTALSTTILLRSTKKTWVNFGPLTKEFTRLMFIHPKCTLCVLFRLMQLYSPCGVLGSKISTPKLSPQCDLHCRAALRRAFSQSSSFSLCAMDSTGSLPVSFPVQIIYRIVSCMMMSCVLLCDG